MVSKEPPLLRRGFRGGFYLACGTRRDRRISDEPARERGCDGAMGILEGRSWAAYHVVDRWSPAKGEFRDMCLAMLRLAGLDLADEPVY